jgi:transcriptional regulator with XRE-family HTH domain
MNNKEKFIALVSSDASQNTIETNRERVRNRVMLGESQQIALKVLLKLDNIGWSQRDLANAMNVSPQQITKIVSGKENLTIETQIKLQNILDIPILASYYENKLNAMNHSIFTIEKRVEKIEIQAFEYCNNYQSTKIMKLERSDYSKEFFQALAV